MTPPTNTEGAVTDVAAIASKLRDEQIGSFKRAFATPGSHIMIDGWSPRWAREDTGQAYCLGLLTCEETGDEQCTLLIYRPTPEFAAHLTEQGVTAS